MCPLHLVSVFESAARTSKPIKFLINCEYLDIVTDADQSIAAIKVSIRRLSGLSY